MAVCVSGCKPLKTGKNFSGTGSFWHLSCLKESMLGLGGGWLSQESACCVGTRAQFRALEPAYKNHMLGLERWLRG